MGELARYCTVLLSLICTCTGEGGQEELADVSIFTWGEFEFEFEFLTTQSSEFGFYQLIPAEMA